MDPDTRPGDVEELRRLAGLGVPLLSSGSWPADGLAMWRGVYGARRPRTLHTVLHCYTLLAAPLTAARSAATRCCLPVLSYACVCTSCRFRSESARCGYGNHAIGGHGRGFVSRPASCLGPALRDPIGHTQVWYLGGRCCCTYPALGMYCIGGAVACPQAPAWVCIVNAVQ